MYLDSFVVPVKRADLAVYRQVAAEMAALCCALRALSVTEAVADGLAWGDATSYPRAVQASDEEVIVVATIVFASKAQKDAVTTAAFADARMQACFDRAPVDGTRMIWGGFDVIVNARSSDV